MAPVCMTCGKQFRVPPHVLDRYPGWTPRVCRRCHIRSSDSDRAEVAPIPPPATAESADPVEETAASVGTYLERMLQQVVAQYRSGPEEGVFTDGGCSGNPGPGGWGAVWVRNHQVVARCRGEHPQTTNNRMELTALLAGYRMIGPDDDVTVWSDSELCVKTFNIWAAAWAANGWRRKSGPIKNLDLIQPLYRLVRSRPKARLQWIKAHNGSRWNEYVDVLATAHLRK